MGKRMALAASQPLAVAAGAEIAFAGGNAVDAAIAMAAALTVTEPTSNGLGGDLFAMVWDGKLHGLNASGRSPLGLTAKAFDGLSAVPPRDWRAVTVPGVVSGWAALSERFGRLSLETVLEPAARYAEEGFPVAPETARAWVRTAALLPGLSHPAHAAFKQLFFRDGKAPSAGQVFASPAHAATLREIGRTVGRSFYQGTLAAKIAAFAAETDGFISLKDLSAHHVDWVDPIGISYRGYEVWEMPPNGQGIAALVALNILEALGEAGQPRDSVTTFHRQVEAMKLAFADLYAHVADTRQMRVAAKDLLTTAYAEERAALISERAADRPPAGMPKGGTVYLATADEHLMVSLIQSNYMGFGAGIAVPGTGIALQNRGVGFTLAPDHPNAYAPGKRPLHTIIPGFLTRGGKALGPFGLMGGPMQPQGHLQLVSSLVDYGENPQTALDAPRWQIMEDGGLLLESSVAPHIARGLADLGHKVRMTAEGGAFGRGQIILRQDGVLIAASEPRADGLALAI